MPVVDSKSSLETVVREYAFPDIHIGSGADESPWVPFRPNIFIRHLAFDVRTNLYANVLWVKQGGMLGRHRHRGRVFGYTLEGSWRYLEYDWIARAGSYVQESPGAIHTLVSDEGMKTIEVLAMMRPHAQIQAFLVPVLYVHPLLLAVIVLAANCGQAIASFALVLCPPRASQLDSKPYLSDLPP